MSTLCCTGLCGAVARHFDEAVATADLDRYRRKGPRPTTRLLCQGILEAGSSQTLLDLGAGIGALSFELLTLGFDSTVAVDASPAYVAACRQEAQRRDQEDQLTLVEGDFVAAEDSVPSADVVAMDRVVCCYPAFVPLLEKALGHSLRLFAFSYPRDRWYIRVAWGLQNLMRALVGNDFRAFVHPAPAMTELIEQHGFHRVSRAGTFSWAVDVYLRNAGAE